MHLLASSENRIVRTHHTQTKTSKPLLNYDKIKKMLALLKAQAVYECFANFKASENIMKQFMYRLLFSSRI